MSDRHSPEISDDETRVVDGPRRGPYRRGRETREEILFAAFELFSRQGYRSVSVREIAQRVGLTQQGLMHHFGSKELLLAGVLALRDELDSQHVSQPPADAPPDDDPGADLLDRLRRLVHHNAERPAMVRLFSVLSVEAGDPDHPAHQYFVDRYRTVIDLMAVRLRNSGIEPRGIDSTVLARLLLAVMDGLQVQWQLDSDLAMEPAFDAFVALLQPARCDCASPRAPLPGRTRRRDVVTSPAVASTRSTRPRKPATK